MIDSQCDRLYAYLATRGSVTVNEAARDLGIPCVMRRVHNLRQRGVDIVTIKERGQNRYGEECEYARYVLRQQQLEMKI